jgi:hypothetical protein
MSDLKAAAQQALEALETCDAEHPSDGGRQWYDAALVEPAITALKAALEQQEPEPVLTINKLGSLVECSPTIAAFDLPDGEFSLYTHPPRREWRVLTDEEIEDCWDGYLSDYQLQMIRTIEDKLKEKNHD